ncbi:MAG: hypothetical protein GY765_11300 [bacterium]|nr:hypothetical protein [bacterium]
MEKIKKFTEVMEIIKSAPGLTQSQILPLLLTKSDGWDKSKVSRYMQSATENNWLFKTKKGKYFKGEMLQGE